MLIEIDKQLLGLTQINTNQQQQQDNISVGDESSSHNSNNSRRSPSAAAVGSGYTMATQISLDYVTNRSFRIMFLRSCYYDIPKTATKIIGHFDKKLELFGVTKLCKKITIADLTDDDLDCLYSGQSQLLPSRDRSGRVIFFQALSHYRYKHVINAVRSLLTLLT